MSNDLISRTLSMIDNNRHNMEQGIKNCIPCPLPRLSKEFVGLEQSRLGVITGSDKSSKTQFVNYLGVFTTLDYIKNNINIDARILYFALEEAEEKIVSRYILYLLRTKYNIITNYTEVMSITNLLDSKIYNLIHSEVILKDLEFFSKHVTIKKVDTVENILEYCKKFAEQFGEVKGTKYYAINPNMYKIVIIDHVGLITPSFGKSIHETLASLFKNLIKFKDLFKFTFLLVQQQSAQAESLESKRSDDTMPTKANLSHYKNSSNDCDFMLGIFNPTKISKDSFRGYIIKDGNTPILGDNARFLKIMIQRWGPLGGEVGLYTDGPNAYFEELPPVSDTQAINDLYTKMRNKNTQKPVHKHTTIFSIFTSKKYKK